MAQKKQRKPKEDLDRGAHSIYLLNYHVIWCVKYRRKVLTNAIGDRLKEILTDLITATGCKVEAIETDIDHVHILLRAKPTHQLSKLLQNFKGTTARLLFIEYPGLRNRLYRGHFWSPSYYVATVGEVNKETVRQYIDMQREK